MIEVGRKRQVFIDELFFERQKDIELVMHQPKPAETAIGRDQPWEFEDIDCPSVVNEGGKFRMWYQVGRGHKQKHWVSYAESDDGVTWVKPCLKIEKSVASGNNNILFPTKKWRAQNPCVIHDHAARIVVIKSLVARALFFAFCQR